MNKLTHAGFELIKAHEGLRLKAYVDPGTGGEPYTIGYGHTSAAGPPTVYKGMTISRDEAEDIFRRDLTKFENHVRFAVKVPISDTQFSALVSFCYNVGPGAFKKSSVLRAVNEGRFDLVPARLALFNKANGKTLKGLVRRRAEEGKMFTEGRDDDDQMVTGAEPSVGKSVFNSTTNVAAGLSGVAAVTSASAQIANDVGSIPLTWLIIGLALVSVAATVWIVKERINKSKEEGV
jgi:lysozyme